MKRLVYCSHARNNQIFSVIIVENTTAKTLGQII